MAVMANAQNNGETVAGGVVGRPFPKGSSGNPGGRPKGLARYVRELVGADGRGIADYMLSVLGDEAERTETRIQAATWLADRGFGKAPATMNTGDGGPAVIKVVSCFGGEAAREMLAARLSEFVPLDELNAALDEAEAA
jgi:hypothetical protein